MPGRGISWTAETHETLLVAIITSGATIDPRAVLDAWPAHKGPAPSLSALSQHLSGLKKKVGASTGAGATTTPTSTRTKKSATGTFVSAAISRRRPSAVNKTLFNGAASQNKRVRKLIETDGSEGDTCASTGVSSSPTPGLGRNGSSGVKLGKRSRRAQKEGEEVDDGPIDNKSRTLLDQLREAAGEAPVKQEPEWHGYDGARGGFKGQKVEKGSRFADADEF